MARRWTSGGPLVAVGLKVNGISVIAVSDQSASYWFRIAIIVLKCKVNIDRL